MSRKSVVYVISVCIVMAFSVFGSGCKKEEKAAEAPGAAPQAQQSQPAEQQAQPAASGTAVKEFSFEEGNGGWFATDKTVKVQVTSEKAHIGKRSLKVTGTTAESSWNYASSSAIKLEPGKKYRLSGWIFVDSISDNKHLPFLKCGINDGAKFAMNSNTRPVKGLNEWQQVSADFTAPSGSNLQSKVAIEKGTNQAAIKATIYIDDVKLEAL